MKRIKKKTWYVGVNATNRTPFSTYKDTTRKNFETLYSAIIGPFKTKRAAIFMAKYGKNNPHLQTVSDAERISKQEQSKEKKQ